TERRRARQTAYNLEHDIVPCTIRKGIRDIMEGARPAGRARGRRRVAEPAPAYGPTDPQRAAAQLRKLEKKMRDHARNLEFEEAARLRDEIRVIREQSLGLPAAVDRVG
ncbi:MAG: UvrB/UvrC motif-containing protein, partial [Gammaproteobacteria bacterium]|nr:UvrB/UvrC motif-containing protein [Gammaproteobacteria bacterium]